MEVSIYIQIHERKDGLYVCSVEKQACAERKMRKGPAEF
ncbi:hypothetical protein B0I26_10212 [Anoxybacillus vitaminiphilus]|uniref:Uncharacterized protein n=1 Tax=Paranoxybacillus vitaminiphilus TaxID=581036 RepID=A0A327YLU0_9BACL|nr:hypothetical protein B0I26_10212 [Anoxybacillus vitaminiphilus]